MQKADFISLVKNVLDEQGRTTKDLFNNKVISENTFYKYRQRFPSIHTLINICNFLKVSIDYLFEIAIKNNFKHYDINKINFCKNLKKLIRQKGLSGRSFCNIMHYSKDNMLRWENGVLPNLQTVLEIAQYFCCSMDDLLF